MHLSVLENSSAIKWNLLETLHLGVISTRHVLSLIGVAADTWTESFPKETFTREIMFWFLCFEFAPATITPHIFHVIN